jgi:hypothetical protein
VIVDKEDKKAFAKSVGRTLIRDYGRKDFYRPEE